MTTWMVSGSPPDWRTASSRWSRRPMEPVVGLSLPSMAPIRSSQTAVDSLATAEPPGSAAALADQTGFTYSLAPSNGLSTFSPGLVGGLVGPPGSSGSVGLGEGLGEGLGSGSGSSEPSQVTPFSLKEEGMSLLPE